MDFFFDTSLIFLALVIVLIITTITGIILVRDIVRFVTRGRKEQAANAGEGRPPSVDGSVAQPQVVNADPMENGGPPHA
jgi:hypothetical protein